MKQAFYIAYEVWEELASIDIGIGTQSYSENFVSDLVIVATNIDEACQIFLDWVNDNRDPYYDELTVSDITHKVFLCDVCGEYPSGIAKAESAWLWHIAQDREDIGDYARFWAGREDCPRIYHEPQNQAAKYATMSEFSRDYSYHGWYTQPMTWHHLADVFNRQQKWQQRTVVNGDTTTIVLEDNDDLLDWLGLHPR